MKNYLRSIAPSAVLGKVVQFVLGRVKIDDDDLVSISQLAILQADPKTKNLLIPETGLTTAGLAWSFSV